MSEPKLLLDVSRTVARARLPVATGIDRVERAYIDWALLRDPLFVACIDARQYVLDAGVVRKLLDWLDGLTPAPRRDLKAHLRPRRARRLVEAQSLIRRGALAVHSDLRGLARTLVAKAGTQSVYLNVGHDNCTKELMRALGAEGIKRLFLLHDTIPLDHPEFTRPETPNRFRTMLDGARLADGMLANSAVTRKQITAHMPDLEVPCWVAQLGVDTAPRPSGADPDMPPSFLCVGTIEPRKNHRMLLHIWKKMHEQRCQEEIPHLHVIGRRGWLNEDVFQDLDTQPFMGSTVFEETADDARLLHLMGSARAVLFPSLAEGYGLPLAEALAVGTPVIASDLPVLREIGGSVPEYLRPDDADAWMRMINAYAQPDSQQRNAQIKRISSWSRPTWKAHFSIVENAIETILVQTSRHR